MTIREELTAIRRYLRDNGVAPTMRRAGDVLRERATAPWQRVYWLTASEVTVLDPPSGVELRVVDSEDELTPLDWQNLKENLAESDLDVVRHRLRQRCELHLLTEADELVGTRFIVWGHRHSFQHVPLVPQDSIGMDLRINPAFRGRRLASPFLSLSTQNLASRGCQRVFTVISVHNLRSIRSFEGVGFQYLCSYRQARGFYRYDRPVL